MNRLLLCVAALCGATVTGCYKRSPGPAALVEAEGPVRLVALPGGGPATDLVVMVRAGAAADPPGQEGVASLTARLLREGGAAGRSSEEVDAALYRLGTDIEVVVDQEIVSVRTRALHEDLGELAALLGDLLTEPAFDEAALERLRAESIDGLQTGIFASDEALGEQVFSDWVWEGNPYGSPIEGRLGSLPALDAADARAFYDDRWVRPAVVLGVSGPAVGADGAIDPTAPGGAAILALRDRLSGLPARTFRDFSPRGVAPVEGRHLLVIEAETDGAGIHFGHPTALTRAHPDWPAMLLAVTALGEHRQSHGRLYRALRGDRGLNYGDYAYIESYRQDGWSSRQQTGTGRIQNTFSTWIRPVSAENGPFALKASLSMVEDWVRDGLPTDEFERTRAYLAARIQLWGEEPIRRLGWAVEAELMGWPDPIDALPPRIASLSESDVRGAIQRHVRPEDLKIVVVTGDGEGFIEALSVDSPMTYGGDPPASDSPQAVQDAAWASPPLQLETAQTRSVDGLFQ